MYFVFYCGDIPVSYCEWNAKVAVVMV